jgi:hypothetical protein
VILNKQKLHYAERKEVIPDKQKLDCAERKEVILNKQKLHYAERKEVIPDKWKLDFAERKCNLRKNGQLECLFLFVLLTRLHNEELHNLYSSSCVIKTITSRGTRWVGHVARIREIRNVQKNCLQVRREGLLEREGR